jgi:hypothetical protein
MQSVLPDDAQEEIPNGFAVVGHIGMFSGLLMNDNL